MIPLVLKLGEATMELLKTFRHEYKYVISYEDMLRLRQKLNEVTEIDRNEEGYLIRSLYFDSIDDIDYYDKLGGELKRKKIRLRLYDGSPDLIKLEMKNKYDIHQLKESLIISKEDSQALIDGNYEVLLNYQCDFANKLYTILRSDIYKPKVIIEYKRIAYTTKNNTRITFDLDIKSSTNVTRFLDSDINYNYLTNKQDVVLEVKFERFLEPYIGNIIDKYGSRNQSISKYVIGRNV